MQKHITKYSDFTTLEIECRFLSIIYAAISNIEKYARVGHWGKFLALILNYRRAVLLYKKCGLALHELKVVFVTFYLTQLFAKPTRSGIDGLKMSCVFVYSPRTKQKFAVLKSMRLWHCFMKHMRGNCAFISQSLVQSFSTTSTHSVVELTAWGTHTQ